jgi:hypothetical protein
VLRLLTFFLYFFFSLEGFSQILPSSHGVHHKKSSGGAASGTRNFTNCGKGGSEGPTQSDCNTAYASNDLNGEVTVTSGIQYWTTPTTGTYTITAIGATAGNDGETSIYVGRPAKIIGDFSLTQGDVLKILVGQHGWKASCRPGWGGGGGTFVTKNDNTILLIAGGCGSGHTNYGPLGGDYTWQDANTGESGNFRQGDTHAAGTNGSGGGGTNSGGSGAGYSGDGNTGNSGTYQLCSGVPNQHTTPKSFLNGGVGDVIGGGFGGGAGVTNTFGGGGGGYSGGGGSSSNPYAGAGGGSKNNGSSQTNTLNDIGTNKAELDGSVVISW